MGSLFNHKAFSDAQEPKRIIRKITVDGSETEDETDPEYQRILRYENCLKKRVYYSDRVEQIEKVLLQLKWINSDSTFCSPYELH